MLSCINGRHKTWLYFRKTFVIVICALMVFPMGVIQPSLAAAATSKPAASETEPKSAEPSPATAEPAPAPATPAAKPILRDREEEDMMGRDEAPPVDPLETCDQCPCEPSFGGSSENGGGFDTNGFPVVLLRGSKYERATDLRLDGPSFSWHYSRNYDSGDPSASSRESHWMGGKTNTRLFQRDGFGVAIGVTTNAVRTFEDPTGAVPTAVPRQLTAPGDYPATLTVARQADVNDLDGDNNTSEAIDVYVLTEEETGVVVTFAGFRDNIRPEFRGRLIEESNRAYIAAGLNGTRYSYGTNGEVSFIITPDPQNYLVQYQYEGPNGAQRVQKINVFADISGSLRLIQQALYTYASSDGTYHGDVGTGDDLIQVVCRRRTSNFTGNEWIERVKQYRYYKAGDANGGAHQMKMVFKPDAVARAVAGLGVANAQALLSRSDNQVRQYVTKSVEYYTDNLTTNGVNISTRWSSSENLHRYGGLEYDEVSAGGDYGAVRSEMIGNCGGCGGGGSIGIRKYFYYLNLNNQESTDANEVIRIVIEDTVGTDDTPQYRKLFGVNYRGAAIRKVELDDPRVGTLQAWCESKTFNAGMRIAQERMPSAHTGVNSNVRIQRFLNPTFGSNDAQTVNANSGVVYHYEYSAAHGDGIRRTGTLVSDGVAGTRYYVSATDWGRGADNEPTHVRLATYVYRDQAPIGEAGRSSGLKTSYVYDFWDAGDQSIKSIETSLPVVSQEQNGSGEITTEYEYFDRAGRLRWSQDGEGYINYRSYHPGFGKVAYIARDVDPGALPTDASGNDAKWLSANDDGDGNSDYDPNAQPGNRDGTLPPPLALRTSIEYDALGRTAASVDVNDRRHVIRYFNNATAGFSFVSGNTATLPIRVVETDNGDVIQSRYTLKPSALSATATSLGQQNLSNFVTWQTRHYDPNDSRLLEVRRYHDISANAFYSTYCGYDLLGRKSVTASEVEQGKYQVSLTVRDDWDRTVKMRSGVLDDIQIENSVFPVSYVELAGDASPLKTRQICTYDGGGTGDSHKTRVRNFHSDTEVTDHVRHFTYRGHLRGVEKQYSDSFAGAAQATEEDPLTNPSGVTPIVVADVDWLGRAVATAGYTSTPLWNSFANGYSPWVVSEDGVDGRFDLAKDFYDDWHRVYQIQRFPHLEDENHSEINHYYDRRGYLVASGDKHAAHREFGYDGVGREYQQRLVHNINQTSPYDGAGGFIYNAPAPRPEFRSMSGGNEGVIELSHMEYEKGLNIGDYDVELNHDDIDGIELSNGGVIGGIRSTMFYWHDDADRVSDIANFGSGDGTDDVTILAESTFKTRPNNRPSWTDDGVFEGHQLVTQYGYHPDTGRHEIVTIGVREAGDNTETQTTKTFHDDLDRDRFVVENWQPNFDPSGGIGNVTAGVNRTTETKYNGLNRAIEEIAYNDSTVHQSTKYFFNDSVSATRVTETIFPDSNDTDETGSDQIKRAYNRDGSLATLTDQRAVVHTYSYNERRQVLLDAATLAAGVDDRVQAIGRSYDEFGRTTKITSYGGITNDSLVRNEIEYGFHASHGRLETTGQDHAGAVDGDSHETRYVYDQEADGGNAYENSLRLVETFYPVVPGAKNELDYSTATSGTRSTWFGTNRLDDRLNRVSFQALSDGELRPGNDFHSLIYNYSGSRRLVFIASSHFGAGAGRRGTVTNLEHYNGSGNYDGFDRFGRPVKQDWRSFRTGPSAAHTERSYDYASNLIERRDPLAASVTAATDAPLNLDRTYGYDGLFRMQSSDETGTANDRSWDLDQLGNQLEISQGNIPNPETRTYTAANELDTSTRSRLGAGDPEHDAAGNMTNVPYPTLPNYTLNAKYDAWNRLVDYSIYSFTTSYQYDGLHRRVQRTFTNNTTHFYYNEKWQVLTETDGNDNATAIYNYHPHFVDAVAVRMRSAAASNVAGGDEHYFLHDHQFSLIAAVDEATNQVVERYRYSARGERTVMDANFTPLPGNHAFAFTIGLGVEYAYTGARRDPTGLQLHRYRYYNPSIGQWINRDPLGYVDGMNLYGAYFVPGATDPTGESPISKAAIIALKKAAQRLLRSIVKKRITNKIKKGLTKKQFKKFAGEAAEILDRFDRATSFDITSIWSWCSEAAELIPIAGDAYGGIKFGKAIADAKSDLAALERKIDKAKRAPRSRGHAEFPDRPPASPAVDGSPFSPREVSKRQSELRRQLGVEPDPNVPIPNQSPGRDLGGHTSRRKPRHTTGERNVASAEEHSRVPKRPDNRGGGKR